MNIKKGLWPWSVDMWSLGVIILECVSSFPVWMSYRGRTVRYNGGGQEVAASKIGPGAFGVQYRAPEKISIL